MLAHTYALIATNTTIRKELNIWFEMDSLRIMAPETAQSTTLQEDGGPDTGPIVN